MHFMNIQNRALVHDIIKAYHQNFTYGEMYKPTYIFYETRFQTERHIIMERFIYALVEMSLHKKIL